MKYIPTVFASVAVIAAPLSIQASGDLFNGTITWATPADPIIATEQWASPSTSLSWNISYDSTSAFPWVYQYSWNTSEKGLSHIILEMSLNSKSTEFSLPTLSEGPRVWSPSDPGNSNPGLPGDIFGIKFDGGSSISKTFTFSSTHAPTWGDFFAKDGVNRRNGQSFDVYAYNSGFLQPDPIVDFAQISHGILTTLQHTGPRANHIAVPDTLNLTPPDFTPVPEASAGWGLVGMAGAAAFGVRRQRAAQARG